MQISKKILKDWKANLDHGDLTKIAEESGISRQTISEAMNTEIGSYETIKAINEFIKRKKESLA